MKAGDHIQITREGVAEHAIDLGDRTVLHFVKGPGVRRSPLAQLACGARVQVVTHRERVYAPRLVVARAFSRLADSALAGMFHDSEEFATWCKTGRQPVRPLAASSVASPLEVARSAARPTRLEAKPKRAAAPPASKRPPARKTGKRVRTAKRAGAAAARPAAKRATPRKPARAVKKAAKMRPAAKAARAPAPKPLKAPPSRRPLAAASPARPVKSAKRPAATAPPKPKRGKTPGKRAAAGR